MKKILISAALATMMLASCQNEEIVSNGQNGNYSLEVSTLLDSRTSVKDNGAVEWTKGDKMYVYGKGTSGVLTVEESSITDGDATEATFTGYVFGNPDDLEWAVFGNDIKATANGAQFTISSVTNPNSNSPMAGKITAGNVEMQHLCGMVRITINGLPTNADIKLTGTDIAGTAEVVNGILDIANVNYSDVITIDVTGGDPDIEIPVFTTAGKDGNVETKSFTLSVDDADYTFEAPVRVSSLSQDAILELTCVLNSEGKVTSFTKAANTPESLKQAIESLKSGESLSLLLDENITLEKAITIPEGATVNLDLYGKTTITGTNKKGEGALINNKGTLVIQGGKLENTEENGDAVVNNNGILTLDGVTIEGASISTTSGYPEYAVVSSGILLIEEGTVISSDRGTLRLQGDGTTTINGGTFTSNDITRTLTSHVVAVDEYVNNTLTINGGTFKHLDEDSSGGVVICNMSNKTVFVNGGNFSGGNYFNTLNNLSDYGFGGTFEVKGGTFSENPNSKYVPSGYTVTDNGNGTWTVSITSEELNKVFEDAIKNGEPAELPAGTYDISSYVTNSNEFIVTGSHNTVIKTKPNSGNYYALGNANGTFDGVTIQGEQSGQYNGFAHAGKMVYRNCVIDGTLTIYSNTTFENCTFNLPKGCYIWTAWGASEVTYNECTFNTAGKALLVYHENGTCTVNVHDCKFYASAGDKAGDIKNQNCAAIEIGNHGKGVGTNTACHFTVNTSGNIYDENFSGEWRIKVYDAAGSVTVNNQSYTSIAIDGKTMSIDNNKNVTINE